MVAIPYGSSEGSTVYKLVPSYLMQYPVCNAYVVNTTPNGGPQPTYSPRPVLVASQPSMTLAIPAQSSVPIQSPQPPPSLRPQPQVSLQPPGSLTKPLPSPASIKPQSQNQAAPINIPESTKQEDSNSTKKDETIIRCSCAKTHCLKLYLLIDGLIVDIVIV